MSYLKTDKETYSYKYLSPSNRAAVDGVHFALEDILNTQTDSYELTDYLDDEGEELDVDSDTVERIGSLAIKVAAQRLTRLITELVVSGIEDIDNFEKRKEEVDKEYETITIRPDYTLYDEEGYPYGTVKSVSGDTAVVVLREPIMDIHGNEEAEEVEMRHDEIKKYFLLKPIPNCTEYKNGRKIEHYKYGGDVVTIIKK